MHLVFEEEKMKKILMDYYSLLGVSIGVYDRYYNPIYLIPKKVMNFCNIIRSIPQIQDKCRNCDITAFEEVNKSKELYIYKCHMGLYEAVAPIIDSDNIIGYVMVGQLLDESSIGTQWLKVRDKCRKFNIPEAELKEAFFKLKQMGVIQIEAVSNIMHACSTYLILKKLVHTERSGLFNRITQYLINNLREEITQESVCNYFNISKSTLYNCLINNISLSLIPYLRKLRLDHGAKLLTTTELSIREVAESVGIPDYNYFSRIFKANFNLTPRDYRTSCKNN